MDKEKFAQILKDVLDVADKNVNFFNGVTAACIIAASNIYNAEVTADATPSVQGQVLHRYDDAFCNGNLPF